MITKEQIEELKENLSIGKFRAESNGGLDFIGDLAVKWIPELIVALEDTQAHYLRLGTKAGVLEAELTRERSAHSITYAQLEGSRANVEKAQTVYYEQHDRTLDLENAIRKHMEQRGHNLCWENDLELWSLLPDAPEKYPHECVPPREEFLANCQKYYESRVKGVEYSAPSNNWISVTERLPGSSDDIVLAYNGSVFEAVYIPQIEAEGISVPESWCSGDRTVTGVTHWQPLPAGPEKAVKAEGGE